MEITIRRGDLANRACGLLAVGVGEEPSARGAPAARLDEASQGSLKTLLASGDFGGKAAETALLYPKGVKARRVLVVGLGRPDAGDARGPLLSAATAARRARELGAGALTLVPGPEEDLSPATLRAIGEGIVLGHHRHTAYLSAGGKVPL